VPKSMPIFFMYQVFIYKNAGRNETLVSLSIAYNLIYYILNIPQILGSGNSSFCEK